MKIKLIVAALAAALLAGCSGLSMQQMAYNTFQNMGYQQCQKDLAAGCPERLSYSRYQSLRTQFAGAEY